jgi:hypothetical protein
VSGVTLSFNVYTPWEIAVLNEGFSIITQARANQIAKVNAPPEEKLAEAIVADMGDPQAEESVVFPGVVGSITPKAEDIQALTPPTSHPVSETEMAMVVQKSLDTRGLAETRELIAPITGGKRWREADPAVWPEIKKVLA